jgi:hypothetical protein
MKQQQAQDIHAINYPFEHFLTDEQLNNTLSNSIFDFENSLQVSNILIAKFAIQQAYI